jgi:hypothetical protein
MKFKVLKEQPLLRPPADEKWWVALPRDLEAMRKDLASNRMMGFGDNMAKLLYWMREAGIDERVRVEDQAAMRRYLKDDIRTDPMMTRTDPNPNEIELRYYMAELGVKEAVFRPREAMIRDLDEMRRRDNEISIALLRSHMRLLGYDEPLSPDDERVMRDSLETSRFMVGYDGGPRWAGSSVAISHYALRKANLDAEVTVQDMRAMRAALEFMRGSDDNGIKGENLALILGCMKQVMPAQDGGHSMMPPLKRFGK